MCMWLSSNTSSSWVNCLHLLRTPKTVKNNNSLPSSWMTLLSVQVSCANHSLRLSQSQPQSLLYADTLQVTTQVPLWRKMEQRSTWNQVHLKLQSYRLIFDFFRSEEHRLILEYRGFNMAVPWYSVSSCYSYLNQDNFALSCPVEVLVEKGVSPHTGMSCHWHGCSLI